jgi:hypothetical protein
VLAGVVADLSPLAERRRARIAIEGDPGEAFGDARALRRIAERLLATMLGAAAPGESVGVRAMGLGVLAIDRPGALAGLGSDTLLAIDDELNPASPLGTGFALRLARNLAQELGGSLSIDAERLTLRLPAYGEEIMGRAQQS